MEEKWGEGEKERERKGETERVPDRESKYVISDGQTKEEESNQEMIKRKEMEEWREINRVRIKIYK